MYTHLMCTCKHTKRDVADIEAIIIERDPECRCVSVCLRAEMKTETYQMVVLEVINLLEGERETEGTVVRSESAVVYKGQCHFQGS